MREVTNAQLLGACVGALLVIGSVCALYFGKSALLALGLIIIALGVGFAFLVKGAASGSVPSAAWDRPVPRAVHLSLANVVTIAWLAIVILIVLLLLVTRGSLSTYAVTALVAFLAFALGRRLQRQYSLESLLPFGVTALLGLAVVLAAFVLLKN